MTDTATTSLLGQYEAMLKLSQQMLDAARKEEWDQLVSISQARGSIEDNLQKIDNFLWQGILAERKSTAIRAILIIDEEVRSRADSRMTTLQSMLGSINVEKKLKKAYE